MDKLVIIPTYNEKENIEAIITAVMKLPLDFHVLIIDDGSPDGTANIVKDLMANRYNGKLHIIERGTWYSLYNRIQMGYRAQIRLYLRDGRGLLTQSR